MLLLYRDKGCLESLQVDLVQEELAGGCRGHKCNNWHLRRAITFVAKSDYSWGKDLHLRPGATFAASYYICGQRSFPAAVEASYYICGQRSFPAAMEASYCFFVIYSDPIVLA